VCTGSGGRTATCELLALIAELKTLACFSADMSADNQLRQRFGVLLG
jgi:hypothetical protein